MADNGMSLLRSLTLIYCWQKLPLMTSSSSLIIPIISSFLDFMAQMLLIGSFVVFWDIFCFVQIYLVSVFKGSNLYTCTFTSCTFENQKHKNWDSISSDLIGHLPLNNVGLNPTRDLDSFIWGRFRASYWNIDGST
jgi:hypothetical protein